jgi:hypothetical protein
MRHLEDLPNTAGYEFIGIDRDGKKFECVVKLNPVGCYGAYTRSGDPCFMRLSGWLPAVQKQTQLNPFAKIMNDLHSQIEQRDVERQKSLNEEKAKLGDSNGPR